MVALAPLFFLFGVGRHSARSLQELWSLGHVVYYAGFTLYINSSRQLNGLPACLRFVVCILATVLVGGVIELCQMMVPGRTASFADVLRNVSGSMIALLLSGIKGARSNFVGVAGMSSALLILALTLFSPALVVVDDLRRVLDFPVLANFERAAEIDRWEALHARISRVDAPVRRGSRSLRVALTAEKYSGLALVHIRRDWRGYSGLCLSVYNPAEELRLHIRFHDQQHDLRQEYDNRFNCTVVLKRG